MVRLQHSEKGFTLVELAIVMTIIGLLIGGILKGQMLMQNARVTAEVAEVKAISAATTTFKDMYNAVPGDMVGAGTRLVGCPGALGVNCNPMAGSPGAGDGIVGNNAWAVAGGGAWAAPGYGALTPGGAAGNVDDERYLFFGHLLLANLIGNVTTAGLSAATAYSFDVTHPGIKLGGGFQVGYDFGNNSPGNAAAVASGISGTVLLQETGAELTAATSLIQGGNVLTPLQASQIDIKMDDGQPTTGYVQAFGFTANCFSTAAPYTVASPGYLQTSATTDCGLIFRIES